MMKKRAITLSIVLIVLATPMLLVYLTFSNSTDCDQLVIDTYELHSNIDIPRVDYVNCYFDKDLNTRISVYDMKGAIDLKNFELVNSSTMNLLQGIDLLSENERPQQSNLYLASGERWGTKWTYAIDRESNRLWAELSY